MAGENSELTFVRCPSCRSLVPAISTKCRMSGATFYNAQYEEEKSKAQGRARQHTATINGADDHETPPALTVKPSAPPAAPTAQFKNTRTEQLPNGSDVDDPLRNYLEEVEIEDRREEDNGADNGSAYAPPIKAAPITPPPAPKEVRPPQPPPAQPKAPAAPSQVVVESGRGRPGGLSFGKPDNREVKKVEPAQQEVKREQPVRQPAPPPAPKPNFNRPEAQPQAPRNQQPPKEERREERQEARPVERRPEPPKATPSSKPIIHEGDLVGWLVDYRDPRGMGLEIRESQFFVSRERLKATDMVLDDDSISTPHALVRITRQNGVEVQDLMSESGIRIRRRDSNSWQTIEERVKLQHGDRIQFGKVEYLIVLVPVD